MYYDAINRAKSANLLVVAPAGNEGVNTDLTPRYPAAYDLDNIISVTGFDANDQNNWNWGLTSVDLASPGGNATSGAAAHATGVAALLRTMHPEWSYQQVKSRILSTVEPSAAFVGKTVTGGRLNAANALGYAWSPTKFYVVNDSTYDQTYEYEGTSQFMTANGLTTGNQAPRGAATTALGDRVWVVDANKNVYVYNQAGILLGSWAAGGVNGVGQLEGIATNGTDVWIVDAKSRKVYLYSGAASRLSGSQNAASSFPLNKSSTNPKDLVTDGTHLWVVDNGTTDKVFKYSRSGSLVGSWTITTSGATSPTGITLDPASPSDLWIVDNATDRVYQYVGGVAWTNGNRSATTSFALAPGNTNPQGIADPPVTGGAAGSRSLSISMDISPLAANGPIHNHAPNRRSTHGAITNAEVPGDLPLLVRTHLANHQHTKNGIHWQRHDTLTNSAAVDAVLKELNCNVSPDLLAFHDSLPECVDTVLQKFDR